MLFTPKTLLVLVIAAALFVSSDGAQMHTNPVRRVILLLQSMMKKSEEQSVVQEETFDMFMCQCKKSMETLQTNILSAKEAIPTLEASVQETSAKKQTTDSDLQQERIDKKEVQDSLQESVSRRADDKAQYDKAFLDMNQNLQSMIGAIATLRKGVSQKFFLQTPAASLLQGLLDAGKPKKKYDSDALAAFLQNGDKTEDSGEILGILEQMKSDMSSDKDLLMKTEKDAVADFDNLESIKTDQIKVNTDRVADLDSRLSTLITKLVNDKATMRSLTEGLSSDQDSLLQQKTSCGDRDQDYGILKKQFADERIALADTIKILANDGAGDLFKVTVVSRANTNFLQVGSSSRARLLGLHKAIRILQDTSAKHPEHRALQLLAKHAASASRHGFAKGFNKIVSQVEGMIALLVKEESVEKLKKDHCNAELLKNGETKTQTELFISQRTSDLALATQNFDTVVSAIQKFNAEQLDLDTSAKAETVQREKEHKIYGDVRSECNGQLEILAVAKNRLAEFYTSSLLQTRDESSDENEVSSSDNLVYTSKQNAKGTAVVAMLTKIMTDIKAEFNTAKQTEDKAQIEYQASVQSKSARGTMISNEVGNKMGEKAEHETAVSNLKDRIVFRKKELKDTNGILKVTHDDCDWLLANFKKRVELRTAEVDGLKNAKTLLCADSKTSC